MAIFGKSRASPQPAARAHVELAFEPEAGKSLLLLGWLHDPQRRVAGWRLEDGTAPIPLADGANGVLLRRTPRADVGARFGADPDGDDRHGFVLYVPRAPRGAKLWLVLDDGSTLPLGFSARTDTEAVLEELRRRWDYDGRALAQVATQSRIDDWLSRGIADLLEATAPDEQERLPTWREEPGLFHAAIDRAFALGEHGLLVFGWFLCVPGAPAAITVTGPGGLQADARTAMLRLFRADVTGVLAAGGTRDDMLGFVTWVALPTETGAVRELHFDLGPAGVRRLRVPTAQVSVPGVSLAREVLGCITAADRLRPVLHQTFDAWLGPLLGRLAAAEPPAALHAQVRCFGTPPADPVATVVVPLYGRFDFMRHQLAHFADDPEFERIDLLYVVDDPVIASAVNDYAAHCHPMFARPFRLLSYGRNLGFAGANNAGVAAARAERLVLLNSDVIPQRPGWVGELLQALDTLPGAGAVGPLLLFGDGGVQHAGMRPRRDPVLPGFLMNTHPLKGAPWTGGTEPREEALLTGACLCLRKADYIACGGFDEGYLVGDFEDSDLCLKLRAAGRRLWLAPSVRLWHLERQSQAIDSLAGTRALVTLYNAWRYESRIRRGELPDPEAWQGT